jgi:Ser/Thr protein kinase RdoA (MazF antagonist)
VYRELLSRVSGLGTPRYHGSYWDPAGERCWLFLELVHGTKLRELPFDRWVAAAAWLARMQARLSPLIADSACATLPLHDAAFYIRDAEAALEAARTYSTELAADLEAVVATLRELAPVMAAGPFVVVHGSFRPRDVLVAEGGRRICVVDWERAALGSPLYDLGGLAFGFEETQLQDLVRGFVDSADRSGSPVPEGVLVALLDLFRLHHVLRTLAGALLYGFAPDAVARLTQMATALHGRVV